MKRETGEYWMVKTLDEIEALLAILAKRSELLGKPHGLEAFRHIQTARGNLAVAKLEISDAVAM